MSTTFKGLVASLALTTSIFAVSGPASAQVLASMGLEKLPQQCDLRMTRRALALDLAIPENLSGVTDVLCSCETVSVQMLDFIRGHRDLEVLLDSTSQQCGGFANVLANVSTASIGDAAEDGRKSDRMHDDKADGTLIADSDGGDKATDGSTGDSDKGTDDADDDTKGGSKGGSKGGDDDTKGGSKGGDDTKGGDDADDGDKDAGKDDDTSGGDDGSKGGDDGDNGGDDGSDGSDDGDKGDSSDDGDKGDKGGKGHKGDKGGKGHKGGKGGHHHDRGDHGHKKDC